MTAHFFVAPDRVQGDAVLLGEEDTHHLATVLRARPGLEVSVADGSGTVWHGVFDGVTDGAARVRVERAEQIPVEHPRITVVHALPKQRKLDEVVQRLTELGVDRIVPVHSARSQVELDDRKAAKAVARWRAVALAAAKQSQRARLPVIAEVGQWTGAFPSAAVGVVPWEESTVGLRDALAALPPADELLVGIGPEGGITPEEVAVTGLPHASLGRTVLRTETAAVVAVAAVRYHFGLMARSATR